MGFKVIEKLHSELLELTLLELKDISRKLNKMLSDIKGKQKNEEISKILFLQDNIKKELGGK